MGEFEQWLKSLNENGRVTYFLGQEGKVAKEAWDFQQSKIEQLEKKLNNCENLLAEWKSQGMKGFSDYARGGLHTRQDCEDALEKALRGERE